ncbi:4-phosphopantetheinyl transferase [Saccharophagus sp. K07]|jgi:4'-phosphopantetheinyl transferase|uniref:4'-phosphopantetheinyl transferase family protein n=1 Tax=Saccharophagus sp. K07 TaxID=2283636 RepID=UPI0016524594|nr:4'-phosphopantetheinyl transferase superfamily protein [Saccharophagus sp. K07]MBC6903984.1 4-phosphopantetheinyl transferase [Saccharophagus sp. K07]
MTQTISLPDQSVHIWLVDPTTITDPSLLAHYHQLMTADEHTKWERYRFDKDKHQHLVTRALIRHTLSLYQPSVAPADWRFEKNQHGKPSIVNPLEKPLFFNLSHTQKLATIAVTHSALVGVDVERIKTVDQVRGLAERCFTEEENAYIFRGDADAVLWRFFKLWTLKEAYLKALGCGMSLSLQALSFSPKSTPIQVRFDESHDDNAEHWTFRTWQATTEHLLSLAINIPATAPLSIQFFQTTPAQEFSEIHCEEIVGR